MNLGLFMFKSGQRARPENISSVRGNIILCQKPKTNLCGKLRKNSWCKIVSRTLSRLNISYVDRTPVVQKD